MKYKYKCLYELTGKIEDVATFLVPITDLPPQRLPLTDEEVIKLKMEGRDLEFVNMTALHRFARAIEASHGIKE